MLTWIWIEFGFYIDGRGNRNHRNFKIEFEGSPEAYAFAYPYVVAFEPNFIEIRNVVTVSWMDGWMSFFPNTLYPKRSLFV